MNISESDQAVIDALTVAMVNKLDFLICNSRMNIVSVAPRKGVTRANEIIVHVHLKSVTDESFMLLTGPAEWVVKVIGNAV